MKNKNNIKKTNKLKRKLFNTIIRTLENSSLDLNYKQLAAKLNLNSHIDKQLILEVLAELVAKNKIKEVQRGKYTVNRTSVINYYTGILDVSSNGNAFFITEDSEKDIFIHNRNLNKGLHHDTVKVYVFRHKKNGRQEGEVVEIIERSKTEFVGVFQKNNNYGFVVADDIHMYSDIFISRDNINKAENGDKVLVNIQDWPKNSKNPFGTIIKVLGKPGDHNTEIHSILIDYGLPYEFNKIIEDEAEKVATLITKDDILKRRDFRDTLTFTIDPKDAKDFDDALSFKVLNNDCFEVGIHIADVTHYVTEKSILEDEAYQRATSVYLVDRVVPMLPEILSNNVCSLRPNEDKLTFSAVFQLNKNAQITNQWFGRTVIHSDKRYTYEDAQQIIENQDTNNKGELNQAVLILDNLAKKLRKKRLQNGAISFDKVEVKFNLDKESNPIGVYIKQAKDANKLIEEFMLLANKKVAEFIGKNKNGHDSKNTFIYRIHDEPKPDKLEDLKNIITKFGYKINTQTKKDISSSLNNLLAEVHGKPEENMIETLTIRTMSKAIYSTQNIGHYGLAFNYYSHFTSPIRRYPDMMTHRLLQHYLEGNKSPEASFYEEKCKHSSEQEYLATKAERDSIKYMQVKYMQKFKDTVFSGVISGVTEWGIYVEIIENKCEGMVRIKDIKDDYYLYDEKQYALIGQVTKNRYQLGDTVNVNVKKTDLERKHLDFNLIGKASQ
ncbi:MAG: ribonuclease R [Flavobacteriaceae bacterium]|nr:ribonuclease R [Flavobacteriaceae bacterium]